jgi:hypothetical protein
MTMTELQSRACSDNSQASVIKTLNAMTDLAQHIQTKAEQVDQLIATCEEALEDFGSTRPGLEAARKEAGLRLSLFLALSRTLADEIADLGEKIEVQQFDFIHAKAG